jgi:hypothetical protein
MELVSKRASRNKSKPHPVTIADAVSEQIREHGDYKELGDQAYYETNNLCYLVGQIVELLHSRHVLLDGDILRLFDRFEEYKGAPKDT